MRKRTGIEQRFVGMELAALGQVLVYWASPSVVQRRRSEWPAKLKGFRTAVVAGLGPGKSKSIPHDLVRDEYLVIHGSMKWLRRQSANVNASSMKKWLSGVEVPFVCDRYGKLASELSRPAPIPASMVDRAAKHLKNKKVHLSDLARRVVAARLGVSSQTVKNAHASRSRLKSTPQQRALASLFGDLASYHEAANDLRPMVSVLDALLQTEYHVLGLYHLTHTAHSLPPRIAVRVSSSDQVKKICRASCPSVDPALGGPMAHACCEESRKGAPKRTSRY